MTGYKQALKDGIDIIVKVDGDGQMDPKLIPDFVKPIIEGKCDYTKGNFFFRKCFKNANIEIIGNAFLSLLTFLQDIGIYLILQMYTAISKKFLFIALEK